MLKLKRFKNKGNEQSTAQMKVAQAKNRVQDWMPFRDMDNGQMVTKEGGYIALSRVQPINMLLKSNREAGRVIQATHEAFNGLREPIQVLCLQRPVDLESYLSDLAEQAKNTFTYKKKLILSNYIRYVSSLAASGEAKEKRFYILTSEKGKTAKEDSFSRMSELVAGLSRGELKVGHINDDELLDLLFTYHNPAQAAFETAEYGNFVQFVGEGK